VSTFACRLVDHLNRYVQLRRSLGYSFKTQAATLQAFGRFVKRRAEAGPLTQHLVLTFVLGYQVTPNVRARRYAVLKNFADYFAVFDSRTEALDRQVLPRSRAIPPARLLEEGELARLLEAAREISPLHPMRGSTLFTIIGLLASTGLRSGEVVRLDRSDVDLEQGILRIRGTINNYRARCLGNAQFLKPRQQVVMQEHSNPSQRAAYMPPRYTILTSVLWSASPSSGRAGNVRRLP
jgi:integrase